jgi:hypothetical protein
MKRAVSLLVLFCLIFGGLCLLQLSPVQAKPVDASSLQDDPTDTFTFTATPVTPSNTSPPTDTLAPSNTPIPSNTPTLTPTPTLTYTPSITLTPSNTATSTLSYQRPLVNLVSSSYDSKKTKLGSTFPLTVVFTNQGQQDAYNVIIKFTSSDLQAKNNGGVMTISSLAVGDSSTISQDFVVKTSTTSYQTSIDVEVSYYNQYGTTYSQSFTLAISVYSLSKTTVSPSLTPTATLSVTPIPTDIGRPYVVISSYKIDKTMLQPGDQFTLVMELQNLGIYDAYNVSMTLGSSSSTNFLPVQTSNTRVLGDMFPKKTVEIVQPFVVGTSTSAGAIPLTVTFSYKDNVGTAVTEDQIITLLVYQDPSLEVNFYEDLGTFTVGQQATLPIQVINLTSNSVLLSDIDVEMDAATLSNSHMFIGSLDGSSSFTLDTEMTPQESGEQKVYIKITYQDSFKKAQEIDRELTITVNEASQRMSSPKNGSEQDGTPSAQDSSGSDANLNADSSNGGNSQGGAGSESIWQMILRFILGLLGFDSAPDRSTTQPGMGGGGGMPSSAIDTIFAIYV